MAEPQKQQMGDGSDNIGQAAGQAAKAAKNAGKQAAKQAAKKSHVLRKTLLTNIRIYYII